MQICRAQIVQVPPTINFSLGGSNAPNSALWDLNGMYTANLTVIERNGAQIPVQLTFPIVHAPNGRLSGPSSNNIQGLVISGNSVFAVTPVVSGKVTGVAGTARATFTVRFSGIGNFGGQDGVGVSGSMSVTAETDPSSNELIGAKVTKFSARFSNSRSISGNSDFEADLPSGVDGTWNLALNVVPSSPLGGTGTITVASDVWGFNLSGRLKTVTLLPAGTIQQELIIKARGGIIPNALNGAGSSASILIPSPFDSMQFNGKVLGQQLNFQASAD